MRIQSPSTIIEMLDGESLIILQCYDFSLTWSIHKNYPVWIKHALYNYIDANSL